MERTLVKNRHPEQRHGGNRGAPVVQGDLARPKPALGDALHTIAKAGISGIPVLGGPAAEVFAALLRPPLAKRMDEWMESVCAAIQELQRCVKGLSVESLQDNPSFISAVQHATQIAMRSHQKEKLEALRNSLMNVATRREPNEEIQSFYLNLIDMFTPSHLRVLELFVNPRRTDMFDLPFDPDFPMFHQVVKDLMDRGLIAMPQHLVARGPQIGRAHV